MSQTFEWDEDKARSNLRKHKVDFYEAATVFDDPFAVTIEDTDHSHAEERFIDLGMSSKARLLVVIYTARVVRIRIIGSRKANRHEKEIYEKGLN